MPVSGSYAFPKTEKKEFDPLPIDVYESEIKDIKDKISHFKNDDGTDKTVLEITFCVAEEGKYKGRLLWKEVAPYVGVGKKGPSVLCQIVNAANGSELSLEEMDAFGPDQVNSLIGKHLRVSVKQKTSAASGKVYNPCGDFLPSKMVKADGLPF